MINTNRFNWKDNQLYFGKECTGFSIFPSEEDLYWVKWPDGAISADYYNITRAKQHCIYLYTLERAENHPGEITDALFYTPRYPHSQIL